jgi:FtsZ-binding cell division protein ZapB
MRKTKYYLLSLMLSLQLQALDNLQTIAPFLLPIIPAAAAGYLYWQHQKQQKTIASLLEDKQIQTSTIKEQQSHITLLSLQIDQLKMNITQLQQSRQTAQQIIDTLTQKHNAEKEQQDKLLSKLYQCVLAAPETSQLTIAKNILNNTPEIMNYRYKGKNLMHHAMLYHRVELLSFLIHHEKYETLLNIPNTDGITPLKLISHQRDNKSLLEAAYDKKQMPLCTKLIALGAGDYTTTSKLFERESLKSLEQQMICLHELRIRQNIVDNGCLICIEPISQEEVTIHSCCYTASHVACAAQAKEHKPSCPKCRKKPFELITANSLSGQKNLVIGLQNAFNKK